MDHRLFLTRWLFVYDLKFYHFYMRYKSLRVKLSKSAQINRKGSTTLIIGKGTPNYRDISRHEVVQRKASARVILRMGKVRYIISSDTSSFLGTDWAKLFTSQNSFLCRRQPLSIHIHMRWGKYEDSFLIVIM